MAKFAKKKHSVYILFNYFNKIGYFHKTFIVLSATSSSICFFHEEKDKQSVAKSLFRDLKNKIYNIKNVYIKISRWITFSSADKKNYVIILLKL